MKKENLKDLDIAGKKFGRLTPIMYSCTDGRGRVFWEAICECGVTQIYDIGKVLKGVTKSCGCLRREKSSKQACKLATSRIRTKASFTRYW